MKTINQLLKFLNKLEKNKIFYKLDRIRQESILIEISVPGEHWEVEFMQAGYVVVEKFISDGTIYDEKELDVLFRDYSD